VTKSKAESLSEVVVDLTAKEPIQVLHVDDEADFLKAAKRCLETQGEFQVDIASSVEEAMEKMKMKEFDVIVSDYVMPGKDGLEFLKELRDHGNNIPFIMFTGKGREEVTIKALNLGADQYFNKIGGPETVYGELAHGVRQVVESKNAEDALKASKNYLETILGSIFTAVVVIDEETHEIVDANPKALEIAGASREHIIGKVCHRFICPAEKGKCPISDLGQTVDKSERVLLRADGERIPILKTVTTTMWRDHKYLIESFIDITERKKAEEELRDSEEKYRNLFENTRDVTLTIDLKGTITSVNKAAVEYGFKKGEIIGKNQLEFVPKRYWSRLLKELQQISCGKTVEGEIDINTPKGTKRAEYRSTPIIIDDNVVGVQIILEDITKRKKTENALAESEERFKTLLEEAPIAICNTDLTGMITYVNKKFEEATGYSRKEIVGTNSFEFGIMSDETLNLLTKRMRERLLGKPSRLLEGQFKRKDGEWIWAEMEGRIIKESGVPVGFQLAARDMTERKRAEKELTETLEKLEAMNEKLGVVGKFTRHDARNKLSIVTMNTFLTKQKLTTNHEALENLSEIESACRQMERIFEFARIYEKLGMEKLVYMDVKKTLKEATRLFSDLHRVKVVNDCHGLAVLADSLLRQLFYNLIDNSLKHGQKVSRIRVHYKEIENEQLELVYEDDGVGISKTEREKIFMEGYGKGTGYGLYLIRKMCKVYGWTIKETGKQSGAQFTITIPTKNKDGKTNYKLH